MRKGGTEKKAILPRTHVPCLRPFASGCFWKTKAGLPLGTASFKDFQDKARPFCYPQCLHEGCPQPILTCLAKGEISTKKRLLESSLKSRIEVSTNSHKAHRLLLVSACGHRREFTASIVRSYTANRSALGRTFHPHEVESSTRTMHLQVTRSFARR